MVQKEVSKKTRTYGIIAVFSAVLLISMVYSLGTSPTLVQDSQTPNGLDSSPGPGDSSPETGPSTSGVSQSPAVSGMKTFSSIDELKNYLNTNTQQSYSYGGRGSFSDDTLAPQMTMGIESSNKDYSSTNIQVAGVDEADTVKTDGQYIYTISSMQNGGYYYYGSSQTSNNVFIVSADPQNAHVVSKIHLDNNTTPQGLFLSQDSSRLVVLVSRYQSYYGAARDLMIMPYFSDTSTSIYVYDISNKANPVLTRNFTVSGSYFNSRMIDNYLYAVTSQDAFVYNGVVPLPAVYEDGRMYGASPTSIYYADMNQSTYFSYTSFYGINVLDDQQQPTNMTVLMSGASTMYVSLNNIYVAYPDWANGSQFTSIYRVKINGLHLIFEAEGSVPGYTINQYAMDEYSGNLRIATNLYQYDGSRLDSWTSSQTNNVYVLNQNMTIIGKLEGLAHGENLHSVRFMGNRGYMVTFKKTDPLFVIDLAQPQNPKVLGELKIPGYSDYLHPYDDTHLIGVGKEAVEAEEGDFAWYQGLKLALFDVSDVNNPRQLSNYVIGDRGTDSPVLTEPKAFLFDKAKNLLVLPVSLWLMSDADRQQGAWASGQMVWQGAYVFGVSLDGGFVQKGNVTHLSAEVLNAATINSKNNYITGQPSIWENQEYWITRALYIGNTLYTVSNAQIKLDNLTNLTEIATINLT